MKLQRLRELAGIPLTENTQELANTKLSFTSGDDGSTLTIVSDVPANANLDALVQKSFTPEEIQMIQMDGYWEQVQAPNVADFGSAVRVLSWQEVVQDVKSWE